MIHLDSEKDFQALQQHLVVNVIQLNIARFRKSKTLSTLRLSSSVFLNLTGNVANREVSRYVFCFFPLEL